MTKEQNGSGFHPDSVVKQFCLSPFFLGAQHWSVGSVVTVDSVSSD